MAIQNIFERITQIFSHSLGSSVCFFFFYFCLHLIFLFSWSFMWISGPFFRSPARSLSHSANISPNTLAILMAFSLHWLGFSSHIHTHTLPAIRGFCWLSQNYPFLYCRYLWAVLGPRMDSGGFVRNLFYISTHSIMILRFFLVRQGGCFIC